MKQIKKIVTWKGGRYYKLPKEGISLNSSNSYTVITVLLFVSITATAFLSSLSFIPSFHFLYQSTLAFKASNSDNSGDANNVSPINNNNEQTATGSAILTYENPSLGIRIQYPSNMSHYETKDNNGNVREVTFVSMPYLTNIGIQVLSASAFSRNHNLQTTSLDQIANAILEQAKQSYPGIQVGGFSRPTTISPTIESISFNYTQPDPQQGHDLDHTIYLIKHNDDVVNADYFRLSTDTKLYPTFINMLNTLELDVTSIRALVDKGNALLDQGNYTQAIQYFEKALAIDPNDKVALANKGSALSSLGNYTQAIQYYDKSLAIDPNYDVALYNKGNALFLQGNYTQAIQYYDKVLAIDPNDNVALYKVALRSKGNALGELGNYTQAIQYYDKSLAIDQNDKVALANK